MSSSRRTRRFLVPAFARALARVAVAAAVFALAAGAATAATLEVRVEGLRSGKGVVRLAVFTGPEDFLQKGEGIAKVAVPAAPDGVTVEVEDLPPGTYALSMFHDENGDDEFDQIAFGLPLEGFGFSNDAPVLLSEPRFEDAAFEVREPRTRITVRMRYWAAPPDGGAPAADAPHIEGPDADAPHLEGPEADAPHLEGPEVEGPRMDEDKPSP